jgi:hypothetical protein
MDSDPKTRREKKGGKKDKKGPYSAKHVRLAVAAASAAPAPAAAKKK